MNPSLYKEMPFDTESFAPVSLLADMAVLLAVHAKNPAKNLGEFIAAAKREPGKMNFSSPGAGSSLHLAVQQRLVDLGVRPIGSNPEEFAEFLKKDRAKWDGVIRAANIRLE